MKKDNQKIRHVAIIMDGNGRWAEKNGLPRVEGHRRGADKVLTAVESAEKLGIEFLTLYAFSTENWKRPPAEVSALMNLLEEFLDKKLPEIQQRGIRLRTVGRTDGLPSGPRKKLLDAIAATEKNSNGTLILALNYGGRAEIVDAVNRIVASGKKTVDEKSFAGFLYAPDIPDPDLLIRTSGELRLSNFLLWQLSYSEIYVTETLWPDFEHHDMEEAVEAFYRRDRRFGGRKQDNGKVTDK